MKIYIGTLAVFVWVVAIIGKHFWPDIDVTGIETAAQSTLAGLGVYHINQQQPEKE